PQTSAPTPIVPGLPVRKASSGYPTYPEDLLSGDKRPAGISSSEGFLVRPKIDLVTPRRARLAMDLPVALRDGFRVQQSVLTELLGDARQCVQEAITSDASVDDDVSDVQTERAKLARHALSHHPKSRFRSRELKETRAPAHASGSAREDHR